MWDTVRYTIGGGGGCVSPNFGSWLRFIIIIKHCSKTIATTTAFTFSVTHNSNPNCNLNQFNHDTILCTRDPQLDPLVDASNVAPSSLQG